MIASSGDERFWMRQALALAALGEGSTSPNPRVGCVVVQGGRAVGIGFHRACGELHAERAALDRAGAAARGATLFVNLEPCGHRGRTPPCSERIVESGVSRVVASISDPDPRVAGSGFRALRQHGVRVETGLLEEQARRMNRTFLHWHETGRPWVTLKAGISLDGMLAAQEGRSKWITGGVARRFAHRMRLRHDAVLVGAGTVRRDDPRLTVRLPGEDGVRLRVVIASGPTLDPGRAIFDRGERSPATRVYLPDGATGYDDLARVADVRIVAGQGGRVDLDSVLSDLGGDGVQSVLVEGGGRTLAAFLHAGLAHEAAFFGAPVLLGSGGGTSLIDGPTVADPASGWRLTGVRRFPLGEDTVVLGRLQRPEPQDG